MPADYDDPAAGELQLAVAIFRQSNEGESGTPLVYLDGGPGGNALKVIPFAFDQGLAALAEGRDLIVFDQRGVGYSNPALDCPSSLILRSSCSTRSSRRRRLSTSR